MSQFIREIEPGVELFRDAVTGIAWAEDHRTGLGVSVHPNIDESGSVEGMVARGWWRSSDRVARSHGWIYNIDRFVCNDEDPVEAIVAEECMCPACIERRGNCLSKTEGNQGEILLGAILSALPLEPRSYDPDDDPGFWTDGEDIFCPSETECEIIASFLEDIFSEILNVEIETGFYDPPDDAVSGERDRYAGFHYIRFG